VAGPCSCDGSTLAAMRNSSSRRRRRWQITIRQHSLSGASHFLDGFHAPNVSCCHPPCLKLPRRRHPLTHIVARSPDTDASPQVRIVSHAFDIIHLLSDQNPIQVLVDAIINRWVRGGM
jgi:hypothetical protein